MGGIEYMRVCPAAIQIKPLSVGLPPGTGMEARPGVKPLWGPGDLAFLAAPLSHGHRRPPRRPFLSLSQSAPLARCLCSCVSSSGTPETWPGRTGAACGYFPGGWRRRRAESSPAEPSGAPGLHLAEFTSPPQPRHPTF